MKDKINLFRQNKYYKPLIVLLTLVLCYLSYIIYCWSNTQSTDNAYLKADIANVSIEINGVVKEVSEDNNAIVKQGQVIALIDDYNFKANLAKAEASLAASTKNIEIIDQKIIIEKINYQKLEQALKLVKTTLDLTTVNFNRMIRLNKDNFISKKALDDAQVVLEKAKSDYNQKTLDLKTSQQTIVQLDFEKEAELSNQKTLEQAKILAQRNLDNTVIKSPINGRLANSNLQVGNYVSPGAILFSIVPDVMYIVANFKETQVAKFKSGMIANLKFDSLSNMKIQGTIRNISPATGATFSLIPPDNSTGNFTKVVQRVPVRIDFKIPESENFRLVPGMSVNVDIRTDQK